MNTKIFMWECKDCHFGAKAEEFQFDHGYYCPECGSENVGDDYERDASWVSVGLYEVSREYGGPEEGGWWYDYGHLLKSTIRCYQFGDLPQAELYASQLREKYQRDRVKVFLEELPHSHFPKNRPHYC